VEGDAEERANGMTFDHQYTIPDQNLSDINFITHPSDTVSFCPVAVTGQDVFISSSDNVPNANVIAPVNGIPDNFLLTQTQNSSSIVQQTPPSPMINSPYGIVPSSPTNSSDTLLSNVSSDIPLLDDDFLKDALLNFEPISNDFVNGSISEPLGDSLDLDDCLNVNIWEESFSNLFPNFSL
jgi:hypothetical protein